MKRILGVLLSLLLLLSLFTVTAFAAEETSATAQGVTVMIDKSNYQQGEKIYYGWSGVTDTHADGVLLGHIGLWASGADHRDEIVYEYTDYESAEIDYDSSRYFTAPTADGSYEVRYYWGANSGADSYVLSVPFTVGNVKTGSISVAQTTHTANTYIAVDYSGITTEMESAQAFVGVFKPGAGHSIHEVADSDYKHVKVGSGQISLHVPNIDGQFELRLYNAYSFSDLAEDNLVMSIPITLSGATASTEQGDTQDIPDNTSKPTDEPTTDEPDKDKCSLCGFCPVPLGLCIFIWIAIVVVVILVIVIIIVTLTKKKKCPNCKTKCEKKDKCCPNCGHRLK